MKTIMVIGATGDVGQGLVHAGLDKGWRVIAAARDAAKADALAAVFSGRPLMTAVGDLSSLAAADVLRQTAVKAAGGPLDAVVVSVNAPNRPSTLLDMPVERLAEMFEANVLTHFLAAQTFLPHLPASGVFIGIGGGTADFVMPGLGHVSMGQAALRMMYRAIARDRRGETGPQIKELMIVSKVNGASTRHTAQPEWLTDVEVGRHVCAMVEAPQNFKDTVIRLEHRDQVGLAP